MICLAFSRKGFVFTLVFVLFAAAVLLSASFYLKSLQPKSVKQAKEGFAADDLASDALALMQAKLEVQKNSTHTKITFYDSLPSSLTDAEKEVGEHIAFLNGEYSSKIGVNVSVDSISPKMVFSPSNLSYSYSSFGKSGVVFGGVRGAKAFVLNASLNESCAGGCASAVEDDWSWESEGNERVQVEFDLRDSSGGRILVDGASSGWVNASKGNWFKVNLENGASFRVGVSGASEPLLSVGVNGVRANGLNSSVVLSGTEAVKASIPAGLMINGLNYSKLVVKEG